MNEGEKIKLLRDCCGLTQQELAEELGVSKQYVSRVENGLTELSKEKIVKLSELYELSVDWFLLDHGDMFFREEGEPTTDEIVKATFEMFKFDNNLALYSLYIISAFKKIKNKYPDATIDDIVKATNHLYSIDISSDWDAEEFADAYKEFKAEGKLYMLFKDRIMVAYRRTLVKNQINKQNINDDETGKNVG